MPLLLSSLDAFRLEVVSPIPPPTVRAVLLLPERGFKVVDDVDGDIMPVEALSLLLPPFPSSARVVCVASPVLEATPIGG